MLTIRPYKETEKLVKYFRDHLSNGDYHSEKGRNVGAWVGIAVERFGITAGEAVTEAQFSALVHGNNPATGESFLIRKRGERVTAYEMLFSAPKSVSILAVTFRDERLVEAHNRAVEIAFQELETYSQTRVRKGLSILSRERRTTGNLIAARFGHSTSRALDPQLHTHNVVMNVTYDPVEKRLKALDARQIYDACTFLSEVYRSALAGEITGLGYELEGGRHTWRIKGISEDLEARFSKRASQIERAAAKYEKETGKKATNNGLAIIAEKTRKAKDHELSEDDQVSVQRSQLTKAEIEELEALVNSSRKRATGGEKKEDPAELDEVVQYALQHVFERKSVVTIFELLRVSLAHARGRVTLASLKEAIKSKTFAARDGLIATREEYLREIGIVDTLNAGRKECDPLLNLKGSHQAAVLSALNPDQKKALETLAKSGDQFMFMRGAAGAGKTFTLTSVKALLELDGGAAPLVLAPSSSATETLREEGFSDAMTIQRFLASDEAKASSHKRLWIVDEAGLLSTRQMEALLNQATEQKARILFVGDTLQHNGVEGGDALILLEEKSLITKASISKITRQKNLKYNEAMTYLSGGRVNQGWEILEEISAFREIAGAEERAKAVAAEYLESIQAGKKTQVVAPTWFEISKVTNEIRESLKGAGLLDQEDTKLTVYKSANFTRVEKKYAPNLEPGTHSLSFFKNRGDFKQGEVWSVKSTTLREVELSHEKRGIKKIPLSELSKSFDVVVSEEKAFARGDKILIRANYASSKTNRVLNGQVVEFDRLEKDGSIRLKDGRTLGSEFRQFSHGYAVTSQSAQGKTCDRVIVSMSSLQKKALSKNHFYVSTSRGRESVVVFTDNKARLKEEVQKSSSRRLVVDAYIRDRIIATIGRKTHLAVEKLNELTAKALERGNKLFKHLKISRARDEKYKEKTQTKKQRQTDLSPPLN